MKIEQITPDKARKDYPVLWAMVKERLQQLTDDEIAFIVSVAIGICHYCYESDSSCQCWNDD